MYSKLADNLFVSNSTEQTPAVAMGDDNAVQVDWTVISYSGSGEITVTVQESNDLQNWSTVGTDSISAVSYNTFTSPDQTSPGQRVASAYVRLQITAASGATAVVAAGLNSASL